MTIVIKTPEIILFFVSNLVSWLLGLLIGALN